jgi:predicted Holliday junction resolvase-like endonuclease
MFLWNKWKYIVIALLCFVIGATIAYKIQGFRIKRLEIEKKQLQMELASCMEANKANQETITSLRQDIKKANQLCLKRLNIRQQMIKKIQQIDKIDKIETGGIEEKNEKDTSDDALLDALNRMYSSE